MYQGNIANRRARLARAYDKADEAYESAWKHPDHAGNVVDALLNRREAIWKAYKRFGIGS
jgi:hypothetical protein